MKETYMRERTKSGKITLICIAAAIVFAFSAMILFAPKQIEAATIRTSTVYSTSDNVKYKGTDGGTQATLTGYTTGAFSFKNKLYMKGNSQGSGMELKFKLQSADFNLFTVSFFSTHPIETNADEIENKIELINNDGKLSVRLIDGSLTATEQNAVAEIETQQNFNGAEITIGYNTADKVFSLKVGESYVKNFDALKDAIVKDEASLKFTFSEVDTDSDKTASVLITSINYQSMADEGSGITDTQDPIIIYDETVYNKQTANAEMTKDNPMLAGVKSNVDMPIRIYDVLQTSVKPDLTIKKIQKYDGTAGSYTDMTEEEIAETVQDKTGSSNCYLKEMGVYEVTVGVAKESGGSDKVTQTFYFKTVADDDKPVIPADYYANAGFKLYAAAGSSYQMIRPEISDASGVDTKYNVTYTIWYKAPSASTWTEANGLKFTPTAEGLYTILIKATDASGNESQVDGTKQINIEFRDEDAPVITVAGFPRSIYLGDSTTLPTANVNDTVDSAPTSTLKLYKQNADGTRGAEIKQDAEGTKTADMIFKGNVFKPREIGTYQAVYTGRDSAGFETVLVKTFEVVKDDRPAISKFAEQFFNWWTILLICIAGVSLISLIVLLVVSGKRNKKNGKKA